MKHLQMKFVLKNSARGAKYYTDYPFESLGDEAFKEAPIREIKVLEYDGNKYAKVLVEGKVEEIKCGYIYEKIMRLVAR